MDFKLFFFSLYLKEFQCEICGEKFLEKYYLKSHLKLHDFNRAQFKCIDCGKIFSNKSNLNTHIKLVIFLKFIFVVLLSI